MDKEISIFKINRAEASYEDGNIHLRLYYPRNPAEETKRIPENLEYGKKVLEELLVKGFSQIADMSNPIKPADGGSMYVFNDGAFLVHRRDKGAPMNKLYHGAPGGYTDTLDSTFSEKGLLETGLRESAEENLLITRDINPRLIVPNDSIEYTLKSAKQLGIELKPLYLPVDILPSSDTLEVFYEDGEHIFTSKNRGFIDPIWAGSTSLSLMQIRLLPISSEEVLPIDGEGMMIKGEWKHFNRESYILSKEEVANKPFGTPLENPRVYQTRIENGKPIVYNPVSQEPFFGPDLIEVTNPHLWSPENHTNVCLDALGVPGFKEKRLLKELIKIKFKIAGHSLIPQEFIKN
ncbi:MAG: hypothetical protein WC867_07255 [Candidatus Pacearchaeota archaeon]|jgi:hypothetical protein